MNTAPKSLISRASIGLYEDVPTQPSSMDEHAAHWIDPQLSQAISLKRIADSLERLEKHITTTHVVTGIDGNSIRVGDILVETSR